MEQTSSSSSEYCFVLDIGTRFVRGLLCKRPANEDDAARLTIECSETREHETRAMRAGQIHDIEKVTKIVGDIKEALERKLSLLSPGAGRLERVAVAVAGRNLVTYRGQAALGRKPADPVAEGDVKRLELLAVQDALEKIDSETEYFCVGYSVIRYRIDGAEISSLLDHRGASLEVEVLVTLLPRQVLEAMFSVTAKLGLEIEYLTLEPIAALESTVSEDLRSLNLALIDIGAGTSDIALVAKGKVLAYGMVPAAGDMITETLCSELLVGFGEAERIKRAIGALREREKSGSFENVRFKDIFSREHERPLGDILGHLKPAAAALADRIAAEIMKLTPSNSGPGAAPDIAAVLVGGGSLTPFIEEELARALQIAPERVGVRAVALNKSIEDRSGNLSGPDAATATGIALLIIRNPGLSLTRLTLNDKRVTVLSADNNPTVLSALLSQGITMRQIYGRPGMAKTFTFNGTLHTVKGETPRPATIEINGEKAALGAAVKEGDRLEFYPAVNGKDAEKKIAAFDDISLPRILFNGKEIMVPGKVLVNGAEASTEAFIEDRDVIEYSPAADLSGILRFLQIDTARLGEVEVRLDVDAEEFVWKEKNYSLTINGAAADVHAPVEIKENDRVELRLFEPVLKLGAVAAPAPPGRDLRVKINGEEYIFPGAKGKILLNGVDADGESIVRSGDIIRTVPGKDAEAVLVDVFRYIAVEPQSSFGKKVKLLIDGRESQYTSPLHDNAEIKVLFE